MKTHALSRTMSFIFGMLLVGQCAGLLGSSFPLSSKFVIDNQWPSGYQVTVTLTNSSSKPTKTWQARFTLGDGQQVSTLWNGVHTTTGNAVIVDNPAWVGGGVIPAGASTTFGMVVAKPINGVAGLSNLTAVGNGKVVVGPVIMPAAPVLQAINNSAQSNQFQVQWNTVANAQGYILQQSADASFSQPTTVYRGPNTTAPVLVFAGGTYFFRVSAFNENLTSPASNVVSTVVNQQQPPTSGSWIVDGYWESWNSQDSIDAIVNMKVDVIDISFANFRTTGSHQFEIAGVEADLDTIRHLVDASHALGKKVKIAVGGATYPMVPQLQTDADALGMAQAVARYVSDNNLDGVDYDIEDYPAPALQLALLRYTRQLMPNKLVTYTPKSPASTTFPYSVILRDGHQYFDYLSIMAYDFAPGYNYQEDVQALIAMGIPASKIVVGFMPGYDDLGVMTSVVDIALAAQYVKAYNLKGIMFWDLNRDLANVTGLGASQATNTAWNVFHARLKAWAALNA